MEIMGHEDFATTVEHYHTTTDEDLDRIFLLLMVSVDLHKKSLSLVHISCVRLSDLFIIWQLQCNHFCNHSSTIICNLTQLPKLSLMKI